jgi:hypothetical protein
MVTPTRKFVEVRIDAYRGRAGERSLEDFSSISLEDRSPSPGADGSRNP